jgi:hypothetical protein
MISISTPTFDLNGSVVIHKSQASNLSNTTRRVSRTATLDGGVAMADMGFSDGDRTLQVVAAEADRDLESKLLYLQTNYPLLVLCCEKGCFLGAIDSLSRRQGALSLSFLVKEKLTED